jgi:hypothetical protein
VARDEKRGTLVAFFSFHVLIQKNKGADAVFIVKFFYVCLSAGKYHYDHAHV